MTKCFDIYTDGGARGNPGPAGAGYVLFAEGSILERGAQYLGETTNNVAEYTALVLALRQAKILGATDVTCYLDSQLIVKQIRGEYKVKDAKLRMFYVEILELLGCFNSFDILHVPRAENALADSMANFAMDHPNETRDLYITK